MTNTETPCRHAGPHHTCVKPIGHTGLHQSSYFAGTTTETSFCLYEWNDAGQTEPYPQERFDSIKVNYATDDIERAIDSAIAAARHELPAGTVFEVRGKPIPAPGVRWDFGRISPTMDEQAAQWGLAWFWRPAPDDLPPGFEDRGMPQEPLFRRGIADAEMNQLGGFVLIARVKA